MRTVFFDIDTQLDFLYPAGALYAPKAERIVPAVARLNRFAAERGFPVVSTTDAHAEDDPEFSQWPPHCVAGTMGQRKPEATLLDRRVVIPSGADHRLSWSARSGTPLILTPHPGEMARLTGLSAAGIQRDRVGVARAFAMERGVTLVLKGQRTAIAFPDGRVWINPTGTPAMGTGGSGDVLTGMIAGFLAQFPGDPDQAVAAAVFLHGLAGEIGARALGEKCLIATDILEYLPDAMEECADVPDGD